MEEEIITIPPELEDMLLAYTMKVIVDNPLDLVDHATNYFTKLRDERQPKEGSAEEELKEQIEKVLGSRTNVRRDTVMGESYNPEEDEDDEDELEVIKKTDEEKQRIKNQCSEIFLFRVLDDVDLNAVIDAMIPKPVEKGQVIIKQGDDGDFFYLIDKGKFDVYIKDEEKKDKHISSYQNEGFFGELALLHNQPRAATVKAASSGSLWAVSRKTFNRLIVKRAFQKRQMYMQLLDEVPQLKPLTDYEKMQVADALQGKSYSEGEIIVTEGDEGDGMYFIVEGNVSVVQKKSPDDKEEEIAQLGKGAFFGELAIVKHQPRAATVIAMEDTKTAFLEVKAFERLLGPCMDIMTRHTETYRKKE